MKNKFLLLDVEDDEKLTTVLSNKTAKRIISFLSENDEATQSELSDSLNLAPSTIHYNLEKLIEVGLVDWDRFHYSQKGREVRHYRLSQQYIIITPRKSENVLEKLKDILPSFFVGVLGAGVLGMFSDSIYNKSEGNSNVMGIENAEESQVEDTSKSFLEEILFSEPWFWFLIGVIVALTVFLITRYFRRTYKKK